MAVGATLLAVEETWQLVRHYDWPVWLFWLLLAVMLAGSVLITAAQMIGDQRRQTQAEASPVSPGA